MTARIRLKREQLDKYMRLAGVTTETALADRMGVDKSSVYRVFMNRVTPGEKFIAGLLAAFPTLDFADLFEVITEEAA